MDVSTVALLAEALEVAMAEHPKVLLIDPRNLTFLDSRGLKTLLDAQEACHTIDCRLLLMQGSRPVDRLVQIAGFDGLFEFVSGLSEVASTGESKTHGSYAFVQQARELTEGESDTLSDQSQLHLTSRVPIGT